MFHAYHCQDKNLEKELADIWPEGCAFSFIFCTEGGWDCTTVEVYIAQWPQPDKWMEIIEKSLDLFISKGALVAWTGIYYAIDSVPDLFEGGITERVWALKDKTGYFYCESELDGELILMPPKEWEAVWPRVGVVVK